jgi:hypothetical protein
MIDLVIGFFGGAATHQLHVWFYQFPKPWGLFSRYVVGVMTIFVFFCVALYRLNREALRDGMLAYLLAAVGVGAGVVAGYFFEVLEIRK